MVYCSDFIVCFDEMGSVIVFVIDLDGGSIDNCFGDLIIEILKVDSMEDFGELVIFDCFEEG